MRALLSAMVICVLFAATAAAALEGPLFESSIHFKVQNCPQGVCIADFDGDGINDMACASYEIDSISVLIGKGGGDYEAKVDYEIGSSTYSIEAADIDGDSDIDLVVNTGSAIYTLDNVNDGTFEAAVAISGLGNSPQDFCLAKVDNDADYDLIVAHWDGMTDEVTVWVNNGSGTFTFSAGYQVGVNQTALCVGDFNGNTYPDIAVSTTLPDFSILLNDGTGTGTYTLDDTYTPTSACRGMCAVAFSDDSHIDLAVTWEGSVVVYGNDGSGGFYVHSLGPITTDGYGLATADFDNQNGPDLVMTGDSVEVYFNNGSGYLGSSNKYFVGEESEYLAVGKLDDDDSIDIAVTASPDDYEYYPGHIAVLLNPDGNGQFMYPKQHSAATGGQGLCTGDFNGDTKPDVATLDYATDNLIVMINNGTGTSFSIDYQVAISNQPYTVAAGNLGGDATDDIVVAFSDVAISHVSVFISNGNGTFQGAQNYTVGARTKGIFIDDLDNDGHNDIATTSWSDQNISVLLNDQDGTFTLDNTYATLNQLGHDAIDGADLDNDGFIDLVVPDYSGGGVQLFYNDQSGGFGTSAAPISGCQSPYQICIEDLDNDTDYDFIIGSNDSNAFSVVLSNGVGMGWAAPVYYHAGYEHVKIVTGNFDGDENGLPDIAVLGSESYNVAVFLNEGAGSFGTPILYGLVGTDAEGLCTADFDDDGYLDLAVANWGERNVSIMFNRYTILTDVFESGVGQPLPDEFHISQNYPNPFNPSTTIQYSLPKKADVTVSIYNLLGRRVKVFNEGTQPAGIHQVVWNGSNHSGQAVATGMYFYQIRAGELVDSRKMLLLK